MLVQVLLQVKVLKYSEKGGMKHIFIHRLQLHVIYQGYKPLCLQYGSDHMLLTSIGAVPMGEIKRLSVSLKDVFYMSLCLHIIQCHFFGSSIKYILSSLDFLNQAWDEEWCPLYLCNLGFIFIVVKYKMNVAEKAALASLASRLYAA